MARMRNATISGRCPTIPMPLSPIVRSTASSPTSCNAMYGMVATIPVMAIISASPDEP